jgi:S1-C subfamily serine protease
MSLAPIYLLVSRKTLQNFPFRLNILFISFLFIYTPNSNSQTLSSVQIYKKVSGAVVVIHAYDDNEKLSKQGSGVVLNDKGYIVTNYHVLSGNKRIEILHGKEIIPNVDIIGIDVEKDILILKIEAKKFSPIKIGNSKSLKIGQRVFAIGSPMGLENSISEGIISGLRSYDELKRNFIQITASISPGSSGGAVVNDKGELIGISSLTVKEGQNLNFAIPIEDVLQVKIGSYSKNDKYYNFKLYKYGYNEVVKGNYKDSIKYYSLYIQKYPNDANAYNNLGIAKGHLEDYREAIQDYNKAILLNDDCIDIYSNRGTAKHDIGDYQGAIYDFTKVIEFNPKCIGAYINRGIEKFILNDKSGACLDWSKAGELGESKGYDLIKEYCK